MTGEAITLAGDVGGTKVNLALCIRRGTKIVVQAQRRYSSAQFKDLSEILLTYLSEVKADRKHIVRGCFGVPGPVISGRCQTVNLPWILEEHELEEKLRVRPVRLVNDLAAMAYGLRVLEEGVGLTVLRRGIMNPHANQALMAPGTGLGEAILFWDGKRHRVSASEGGHCDFGPQNEEQIELLKWLWDRHKHASWEHVASGPGIYRVYRFLKETGREKEPQALGESLAVPQADPSPIIAAAALRGEPRICVRTMDLWLYCVGAEASNLALKTLSFGGLFVGGGVVPHVLELFKRDAFSEGFDAKGRMTSIVSAIPVYAVTDQHTPIYGAALAAEEL
ncbi:MAG: glucokinase [Bdellovibrionota bacterium]